MLFCDTVIAVFIQIILQFGDQQKKRYNLIQFMDIKLGSQIVTYFICDETTDNKMQLSLRCDKSVIGTTFQMISVNPLKSCVVAFHNIKRFFVARDQKSKWRQYRNELAKIRHHLLVPLRTLTHIAHILGVVNFVNPSIHLNHFRLIGVCECDLIQFFYWLRVGILRRRKKLTYHMLHNGKSNAITLNIWCWINVI